MEEKLIIRAVSAPWRSGIEFLAKCLNSYGRPLIFDVPVSKGITIEPTFSLSIENAQLLMDDLWAAGLRPTEGTGSAGSLAATERHLADMRRLVFEKKAEA